MSVKELLGEELFEKVQEKLDEDTELIVNDGSYVPRDTYNSDKEKLKTEKEALQQQLQERDQQIEQLKNDTQASKELQEKIEELQEKNEQTKEEMQEKLQQTRLESEIEKKLLKEKARNPQAVKALIDMEEIELEDGEVKGLDDQLENIKESDDYLFGETGLKGDDHNDGDGPVRTEDKNNPFKDGQVNLTKQGQLVKNEPEKAAKLIKAAGKDPENYGL